MEAIPKYLHDRLHPSRIRQLEVWRTKLEVGTKYCDKLRHLVPMFYECGMGRNSTEDWLILLCLLSTTNEKLLHQIFKNIKDINTVNNMIKLIQALQALIDNSSRVLGLDVQARSAGGQGWGSDKVLKCY